MDKRLIVIATKEELNLIQHTDLCPVLITGVGALNVMRALQDVPRDTLIINFGYCGAGKIPVGTTVQVSLCDLYHPGIQYTEGVFALDRHNVIDLQKARCHTITDFGGDPSLEGCVFDMELAFILGMGFEDVISIKTVSDNCNLEQYNETIGHGVQS